MPGSAHQGRRLRTSSTALATRHQRRPRSSPTGATTALHSDCTDETRLAALVRPSLPCAKHVAALEVDVAIDHRKRRMPKRTLENQRVDPGGQGARCERVPELVRMSMDAGNLAQPLQQRRQSADVERCVCASMRIPPRREPEVRIARVLRATRPDVAKELPRIAVVSSVQGYDAVFAPLPLADAHVGTVVAIHDVVNTHVEDFGTSQARPDHELDEHPVSFTATSFQQFQLIGIAKDLGSDGRLQRSRNPESLFGDSESL